MPCLSHSLTAYYLVTVVDSCSITRFRMISSVLVFDVVLTVFFHQDAWVWSVVEGFSGSRCFALRLVAGEYTRRSTYMFADKSFLRSNIFAVFVEDFLPSKVTRFGIFWRRH